jgi:hypothetical protein
MGILKVSSAYVAPHLRIRRPWCRQSRVEAGNRAGIIAAGLRTGPTLQAGTMLREHWCLGGGLEAAKAGVDFIANVRLYRVFTVMYVVLFLVAVASGTRNGARIAYTCGCFWQGAACGCLSLPEDLSVSAGPSLSL